MQDDELDAGHEGDINPQKLPPLDDELPEVDPAIEDEEDLDKDEDEDEEDDEDEQDGY